MSLNQYLAQALSKAYFEDYVFLYIHSTCFPVTILQVIVWKIFTQWNGCFDAQSNPALRITGDFAYYSHSTTASDDINITLASFVKQ